MSTVPPPKDGPVPPRDDAPLELQHTPAHGAIGPFGVKPYVAAKLAQARAEYEAMVQAAMVEATRKAQREVGEPVLPKALTPWFLVGFTLCGSVTATAMSFEGVIPRGVLVVAAIGSMFFGALLGIGPGLRK